MMTLKELLEDASQKLANAEDALYQLGFEPLLGEGEDWHRVSNMVIALRPIQAQLTKMIREKEILELQGVVFVPQDSGQAVS